MTDINRLIASLKRRSAHVKEFGDDITFVKLEDLDALVATIEKSKEESGCPAGVDLQDWVKQLAAENVGLKEYRPEPYGIAIMGALDAFFADEEVPERAMMAAFEILCAKRMPTPATDRIVAAQRSAFVDEAVAKITESGALTFGDCIVALCQLREGADK
ncbi:hypothetical protein ACQZD5_000280 [Klebsiella aerogenes]